MPILIINHDEFFLEQLKNALEAQGYVVIATANSLMAEQLFFQHKPRAVILNISMPYKDGFEIIREIRTFCQKTFILAVSSNQNYLRAIKKLGANEAMSNFSEPVKIVNAVKFSLQSLPPEKTSCAA